MLRAAAFLYGVVAYAIFLASFVYAVGFVGNFFVPKSIDSASGTFSLRALLIDVLLLGLFAVQHSGMARQGFKKWWTRLIPTPIERSTYVILASLCLLLLYWLWQPMTNVIWSVQNSVGSAALRGLFGLGWLIVLSSTFMVSHADLFGLRQVGLFARGKEYTPIGFKLVALYQHVRHPLYLGFLMAFWSTPTMTAGHLLFALATTGYILIAIQLEERDLVKYLGDEYKTYRERTSMLLPFIKKP